MWILPRQLHTSVSVLGTEALISGSSEQSQACARWLLVRSKPLPVRTWCLKWSRDSWTRHLSGRILKPSLGDHFVTAWTSSLGVTHASHSQLPESDSEKTIPVTSGHSSQMELLPCDQGSASLRTSKDISLWGCPTSSKTWQDWVTERRGAYSARLKSERLTNANESSSWPTATSRDWKDGTAESCQNVQSNCLLGRVVHQYNSTHGNHPESWATPRSGKTTDENPETWAKRNEKGDVSTMPLTAQVKAWPTPASSGVTGGPTGLAGGSGNREKLASMLPEAEAKAMGCGKLNPRWVETLMGLPVGWTMPSCASPVTIGQTS